MDIIIAFTCVIIIAITFLIAIIVMDCIFTIRNEWVYSKRMEALDKCSEEYNQLLSYDEMLNRWWIWDIEKLKKPNV